MPLKYKLLSFEYHYCISLDVEGSAISSAAYNVRLLFCFLGGLLYNLSDDMSDKCFSSISISRTVSFLVFNADLKTQIAFIEVDENLFRFFVFKSVKTENIISGSAFEFGSDLTAFKRHLRLGYLSILVEY